MKFGFMSMSMTYFSSLNMIKAMRQVGTANALFANPMVSSVFGQVSGAGGAAPGAVSGTAAAAAGSSPLKAGLPAPTAAQMGQTATGFVPVPKPGGMLDSAPRDITLWTISDVAQWLDVLSLGQYKHVFAEAAVDGAFLLDLNDEVSGTQWRGVCGGLCFARVNVRCSAPFELVILLHFSVKRCRSPHA